MEPAAATEWITNEAGNVRLAADFDTVAREYWPRVFRFLVVSLRDRGDAESLTQDCFLKAFQAWRGFRGECGVNTWLMRIAVNQLRDHARNRRLQFWKRTKAASASDEFGEVSVAETMPDGRASPEMGAVAKQQVAAVWRAASALPQQQRAVFLLRFLEDLDLLEIAKVTGLKEGTVKTHLFRALQTVRAHVDKTV
jgi:RNA polymerase sigma-70 factor, ECF subfamily